MKVKIYPSRFILNKEIDGSKALTHRFLLGCLLSNEGIILDNIPNNDDIKATLNFLKAINKEYIYTSENSIYVKPSKINNFDEIEIDVLNSASSLRFILPLSLNIAKKVIFKCNEQLINKTLSVYEKLTEQCNLIIKKEDDKIVCSGSMNLDYYEVDGSISSQFITGLIINALYLKKAITIKIIPPFVSFKYVLMSVEVFKKLGFDISYSDNCLYIHNNHNYIWDTYFIEGDYSIASNYIALAALNGSFIAKNLNENSIQEEKVIIDIIKSIGGNVRFIKENDKDTLYVNNNTLLEKGIAKQLKAFSFDMESSINLIPILMVVASLSNGISTFSNLENLKDNEKDRVYNMINILKQLGVSININNDKTITIKGKKQYFNNVSIDCYNDHRILMALSVFALLNNGVITIDNIDCINKSDVNFFNNLIKGCKDSAIQIID